MAKVKPEKVCHSVEEASELVKHLANPNRLAVICYLMEAPRSVAELEEDLGISQPTLSHHLKKRTDAGLITRQQRGRWAHYAAVPGVLEVAREFLGASTEAAARCC